MRGLRSLTGILVLLVLLFLLFPAFLASLSSGVAVVLKSFLSLFGALGLGLTGQTMVYPTVLMTSKIGTIIAFLVLFFFAIRLLSRNSRKVKRLDDEETRMMQEIHDRLMGMEQRIESLETILLEKTEKESDPFTYH